MRQHVRGDIGQCHARRIIVVGSFVQDLPHGIHWDGNRVGANYTTRLYITGIAPATNHGVDEDGKDLPPQPRGGGRRE